MLLAGLHWARLRAPATVVGALLTFGSLAAWGGTTRPGPLFWAGVAALCLLALATGWLAWWLFVSPLPPGRMVATAGPAELRLLTGTVVLIGGALFAIGGLWDEVWHTIYGGFGNDFLWPPHLMMYGSLAIVALCAAGVLAWLARGVGRGAGPREVVRAEPAIGLLGLAASFLVVAAPSDELWHRIYGIDITAWSLPHIQIVVGFVVVMLATATLLLGSRPGGWRGPLGMGLGELLALVAVGWGLHTTLQVGATEWNGADPIVGLLCVIAPSEGGSVFERAFWNRPEWLFPVVLAAIGLFFAQLSCQLTRRAGAATVGALVVVLFRGLTSLLLQAAEPRTPFFILPHLLMLAPAIAVDLWYGLRGARGATTGGVALGSACGGAAILAAALPAIAALLPYPRVDASTLPAMLLGGMLAALAAGGAGASLGAWLSQQPAPAGARAARPWVGWAAAAALALLAGLAAAYMFTAPPPVV